ncbi:hypothetical protein [Lutimonas zeaxanthinifaciens]|uniref:hypothetical protein n=1 Tax=Lutimonas zeaxanthinifaciens TaxID=3060215 RepID=UPI00265CE8B0|nr:hypothetical protein [Lutimonas sp. YSD2104]WKK67280.1 hypothetical protein QZH61_06555 [Lutimonas sp. YSD2104]
MSRLKVIYIILLISLTGYGQNNNYAPAFWKLMSYQGEVELYGQYKEIYSFTALLENKQSNLLYSGRLDLNTKSYFWHPNFMVLDLSLGYNPGAGQDVSILMPDYAIRNSAHYLNARASFLNKQRARFSGFFNYRDSYGNLENLTRINTKDLSWGGNFDYHNRILPISLVYKNFNVEQQEEYTDRLYLDEGYELLGNTKKSFGKLDEHEFFYTQRNYSRELVNSYITINNTSNFNLRNRIFFDRNKRYLFTSNISKFDQKGTNPYDRFWLVENLNFRLPYKVRLNGMYKLSSNHQSGIENNNQDIQASVQHQLYQSLYSSLFYKNTNNNHSNFNRAFDRLGFDLNYKKKIPLEGGLFLNYNYFLQPEKGTSKGENIVVVRESHLLTDGIITLLKLPNVYKETVVVTDESGNFIYQENIDYILIERDEFLEIQRVPGGLIPNGSVIYVDYIADSLGDYKFDMVSQNFMARVTLFNNNIEAFYRFRKQDYNNVETDSDLAIQYIDQQTYGLRINSKYFSAGFENDDYKSNIVPYNLTRYFVDLKATIKNRVNLSLKGSFTDYHMIQEEGRTQSFLDISGYVNYRLGYNTQFDLRAGYRKQDGEGIDLDLFIAGAEITTEFRRVTVKLIGDLYRKNYLITEKNHFNAVNLRIIRKF